MEMRAKLKRKFGEAEGIESSAATINENLQMRVAAPRKRWPKRSTDMNALLMDAQI